MNGHIQLFISTSSDEQNGIIVAELSELGFEGFEETQQGLEAFISETAYDEEATLSVLTAYQLKYTQTYLPPQNWNALWERDFEPVVVDNFCSIRADFHQSTPGIQHEIIITPKMSFGTGHHPTTFLMIRQMQHIDFNNKLVADFGTGTGVLAILAEKLGSRAVTAIDYDDWSIENAAENLSRNGCTHIQLVQSNQFNPFGRFQIILANINKNIILAHFASMVERLEQKGYLLLSGLLINDESDIIKFGSELGLKHLNTIEKDNWISILMQN